jgi:hypothetical protein
LVTKTAVRETAAARLLHEAGGPREVVTIDPLTEEGVFGVVMEVTPDMASTWLQYNSINRPLRADTVQKYADIIQGGEWRLNGDSIKFDKTGQLIDGQHRLCAIVVANIPVPTMVVFGCETSAITTLDRPKKRSVADVLSMKGEKNTAALGAVLSWYWKYSTARIRNQSARGWPEPQETLRLLGENPGIRDSLAAVHTGRFAIMSSTTALAVAHYILSQRAPEDTKKFFELLANPVGLDVDHPINRLRERLIMNRTKRSEGKLPTHERIAIIFKVWNAWRAGRNISQLAWRGRGDSSESFPEPEFDQ